MSDTKCSDAVLELINALKREIPDEKAASAKYVDMATKLVHFRVAGEPVAPLLLDVDNQILHKIATEEASHARFLEAIVENLTHECKIEARVDVAKGS